MFVITQDRFGDSSVLRMVQRPLPKPIDGELLVRVVAAGVNPVDAEVREGTYAPLGDPPFTLGWDVAGVVEAVGTGVKSFTVGDKVFGMPLFPEEVGAYSTHVVAPAAGFALIPPGLTFEEAGALPIVGLTAWQALVKHGRLKAGQKVLIHAGAGGFGHVAVQIAVALGAEVTATTSASKLEFVRSLGATRVVDYKSQNIGDGFDLVIDPQSGMQAISSVAAARNGGTVICLNEIANEALHDAENRMIRCEFIIVEPDAAALNQLSTLFIKGALKIHVAKSFPLSAVSAAQDYLAEERPIGKVVLKP